MWATARHLGLAAWLAAAGCGAASLAAAGCGGRAPDAGAAAGGGPGAGGGARATLFSRLGGMDGIRALVDELALHLAADDRVQGFFADTDFRRFKAHLVVQLCALTGGPCRDRGRSLRAVHAGRGIRAAHFDAFLEDVAGALETLRAGERERDELLGALRRLEPEIVAPE